MRKPKCTNPIIPRPRPVWSTDNRPPVDPSDRLCLRCVESDTTGAYQTAVLINAGDVGRLCDRCGQMSAAGAGLYVVLEDVGGSGDDGNGDNTDDDNEPVDPDAICAQQEYDDAVHADAVADARWEDVQSRETGADRCPPRE